MKSILNILNEKFNNELITADTLDYIKAEIYDLCMATVVVKDLGLGDISIMPCDMFSALRLMGHDVTRSYVDLHTVKDNYGDTTVYRFNNSELLHNIKCLTLTVEKGEPTQFTIECMHSADWIDVELKC